MSSIESLDIELAKELLRQLEESAAEILRQIEQLHEAIRDAEEQNKSGTR